MRIARKLSSQLAELGSASVRGKAPSRKPAARPTRAPAGTTPRAAISRAAASARAERVDGMLQRTVTHLKAIQKPDGRWDTPFIGSPLQLAVSTIALAEARVSAKEGRFSEILAHFERTFPKDKSKAPLVGSKHTIDLVKLALQRMCAADSSLQKRVDALTPRLTFQNERTDYFNGITRRIVRDFATGSELTRETVEADPDSEYLAPIIDYDHGLSTTFTTLRPAIALLLNRGSFMYRVAFGHPDDNEEDLARHQDYDGSWAWSAMTTAIGCLALIRRNRDNPALAAGIDFLKGLNDTAIGAWTRGDAWDTGLVALTLQGIEGASAVKAVKRATAKLLEPNHVRGGNSRFSFNMNGTIIDNDTSSTILRALCARYPKADAKEKKQLVEKIIAIIDDLKGAQSGQGWSAFAGAYAGAHHQSGRPQTAWQAALFDWTSDDLTARVLSSLVAARNSGAWAAHETLPKEDDSINEARARLERNLESAGGDGTGWYSRWIVGDNASYGFCVPALLRAGTDKAKLAKIPPALLAKQNRDGGWGGGIAEDWPDDDSPQTRRKAQRLSSPVHTASAMVGLIGAARDNKDPQVNEALARAVDYLALNEKKGEFKNGRPLYVGVNMADYYDADASTTCFAAAALQLYRDYVRLGPDEAMKRYIL